MAMMVEEEEGYGDDSTTMRLDSKHFKIDQLKSNENF
jgi:hypothetical protein